MPLKRVPSWVPIWFIIAAATILLSLLASRITYQERAAQQVPSAVAGDGARRASTPRSTEVPTNAIRIVEQICEDAATKNYDYSENVTADHFDLTLSPGCFDAPVHFPKSWRSWFSQPIGNTSGWWVAYWLVGDSRPHGPYGPNTDPDLNMRGGFFRLEGNGRIRLYTNDVVPTRDAKGNSDAPTPEKRLSRIHLEDTDPHICEKPDDAYYAHYGPAVPHPAGYQDYSNPKFLFDVRHSDQVVNWTNGFTGTVPVCFIVSEAGNPDDIRFVQSPGKDIEDHMRTQISGWRYEPGRYDDKPIRVQLAFNFVFQQ